MKKTILIAVLSFISLTATAQNNKPDEKVNLALEASLEGNAKNGRGNPIDVVWDFAKDNCVNADRSQFSEFGDGFNVQTDSLFWQATFKEPKLVNYITFGGAYENQPLTNVDWIVTYKESEKGKSIVLDKGVGGWISNGNFVHDTPEPITVYSINFKMLKGRSKHFRCRGGKSLSRASDDTANATKGAIISFRPYDGWVDPDDVIEEPLDPEYQKILELTAELQKRAEAYNLKNKNKIKVVVLEI